MKEQVIVFEGEDMFISPKKSISNKKRGIQIPISDNINAVGLNKSVLTPIEEPPIQSDAPKEPDEPIRIISTPPSGSSDISVKTFGGSTGGAGTLITPPPPPPPAPTPTPLSDTIIKKTTDFTNPDINLGSPIKKEVTAGEELPPPPPRPEPTPWALRPLEDTKPTLPETTTTTTTTAPPPPPPPPPTPIGALPLVPLALGSAPVRGGGGGGGGSEEEAPPVEEKKTNYLWLVLLGIAGLIYFTKKKS